MPEHIDTRPAVLIICRYLPYPPRSQGFSIRYAPIIEALAGEFRLHLLVMSTEADMEQADIAKLDALCQSVTLISRRTKRSLPIRAIRYATSLLPGSVPYELAELDHTALRGHMIAARERCPPDVVLVTDPAYATLALNVFDPLTIIWDAIDSAALGQARAEGREKPSRLVRRLQAFERRIGRKVVRTAYISPVDARFAQGDDWATSGQVEVIPNGVYLADHTSVRTPFSSGRCTIGFLGNMGYGPNIVAALELASTFARARERHPSLRLKIIGRDPASDVLALANIGVEVTGTVENVWGAIDEVDVFVFPLRTGAGLQNKMLEVMHSRRPVICTSVSNGGVGAEHGKHLLIAEEQDEFLAAIDAVISDPEWAVSIGRAGGDWVDRRFGWGSIIPRVAEFWRTPLRMKSGSRVT